MDEIATYDIQGLCRIGIRGLQKYALEDLNEKYAYFKTNSSGPFDLFVDIGPFKPNLAGATHIDHQYFVNRNYIFFKESLLGYSFEVEITGLEMSQTTIRFHTLSKNISNPAHLLYPDLLMHSHVLQILLELKLGMNGFFLLHGAAFSNESRATVLVGRGFSFKTTYSFQMVRKGFDFLGDDLILFNHVNIYPFPIHPKFFDFYLGTHLESESEMVGLNNFRMMRHLIKKADLRFIVPGPCQPDRIIVIHPRIQFPNPVLSKLPLDLALQKAWINMKMEHAPDKPAKYIIGNFMNAYGLVYPDHIYKAHEKDAKRSLQSLFNGKPAWLLETDTHWQNENLQALEKILE